jgi:hypothetical protein
MIVQAYFGHYTFRQWANFDAPLQLGVEKEPIMEGWRRPILRNPCFRGVLKGNEANALAKALDSLTTKGNHIKTYANITGIQHDTASIANQYQLTYCRLNLNKMILK